MVSEIRLSRRALLRDAAYLGAGAVVLSACTGGGSSDSSSESSGLPDIEGGEVITDPSKFPTRFNESPEFAELVAAGELDSVDKRIGQDPLVIQPVHEIGTYGGTIRRPFQGVEDTNYATGFCAGPGTLLYWDYRHENLVPNIARDWEMSDDATELTLHLRRGMHWSDGHPFTADDIIFWHDDINLNTSISAEPSAVLQINGHDVQVERVDDFTVRYRSPVPYAALPEYLASAWFSGSQAVGGLFGDGAYAPKHYLSKFLPKFSSETEVTKAAKDANFDTWVEYLLNRNSWAFNPDLPVLTPWTVTRPINQTPWQFAANPYSIWVDTEGNQLPYISTISMTDTSSSEVITVQTTSGNYDFVDRGLPVDSFPVLSKGQDRSDYTLHQAPFDTMDTAVLLNLAYDKNPEIGDLIRTVEFRRALSFGIDRHQINQTFFLGTSTPSATMCADDSPYFPGPEWRTKWATHDVDQANHLLDQIGLTERDGSGYRMLPSGKGRVQLDIESSESKINYPAIGEMVRGHWKQIGVYATNSPVDGALVQDRTLSGELMATLNEPITSDPFFGPNGFLPVDDSGNSLAMGYSYVKWFQSEGNDGTEPPDSLKDLKTAVQLYRRGLAVPEKERVRLGKQIFQLHADQVWTIGITGFGIALGGIYCANNNLGNVPARCLNSGLLQLLNVTLPMTFYYK